MRFFNRFCLLCTIRKSFNYDSWNPHFLDDNTQENGILSSLALFMFYILFYQSLPLHASYIGQTELRFHYPCLGIFGHGSNGTPSLMTLTLVKGFRILLHFPHKGKWMFILIMLVLYLAQNSSRYMPNVLLNVDPKTIKIGFIVESKIHLQNPSFNKTSEKKMLIFQPMRGRLIEEELSCDSFWSYTFWIWLYIILCIFLLVHCL